MYSTMQYVQNQFLSYVWIVILCITHHLVWCVTTSSSEEHAASIVTSFLKVEAACFSSPLAVICSLCCVITQQVMKTSNPVSLQEENKLSTATCYISVDSCFTPLPDIAHIYKIVHNQAILFPNLDQPPHLPPTSKIN